MRIRWSAPPANMHSLGVLDPAVRKVFESEAEVYSHPVGIYLARIAESTRGSTINNLRFAMRVLSAEEMKLKEFPWWELRYNNLATLRHTLVSTKSWQVTNHILNAVRQVLKECWRLRLMPGDEFERCCSLELARGQREVTGRFVRAEELKGIYDDCRHDPRPHGIRDAAIYSVFYCTGLRRSEVQRLNIQDYDSRNGEILVHRDKLHRRRIAFIQNEGKAALDQWIKLRGTEPGPLFVKAHRKGLCTPLTRLQVGQFGVIVRQRALAAGVGSIAPHDLRRSFVSNLLDKGVDLLTVRQAAGHISLASTISYDLRGKDALENAAKLITVPFPRLKSLQPVEKPRRVSSRAARASWWLGDLYLGKYAWSILDAMHNEKWITVSIPSHRSHVLYGSAARTAPKGLIHCNGPRRQGESKREYYRRHNQYIEYRRTLKILCDYGLVVADRSAPKIVHAGMPWFKGYQVTPLGRLIYGVACKEGLHRKRLQLRSIREQIALALDEHRPTWIFRKGNRTPRTS